MWMCSEVSVYAYGCTLVWGYEAWGGGTSIVRLMQDWGGSAVDQNTSWVIVGYPLWKNFTQCSFYVFLRRRIMSEGEQTTRMRRKRNSSTAWTAYAHKKQESCDNSYRLSKAGHWDAVPHRAVTVSVSFLNSPAQPNRTHFVCWCSESVSYLVAQLICSVAELLMSHEPFVFPTKKIIVPARTTCAGSTETRALFCLFGTVGEYTYIYI